MGGRLLVTLNQGTHEECDEKCARNILIAFFVYSLFLFFVLFCQYFYNWYDLVPVARHQGKELSFEANDPEKYAERLSMDEHSTDDDMTVKTTLLNKN